MAKNQSLQKKIKKAADQLIGEGSLWGFDFDDIIIKGRRLSAKGDFDGVGGVDADLGIVINFNKRAKPKEITMSFDFDNLDTRLVQGYEFSNYKKFGKAIKKDRYADKYDKAMQFFDKGTKPAFQKGVDTVENIPGVSDVWISVVSTDIPSFYIT